MPMTKFMCPDKVEIDFNDCIQKCRMSERCVSLPTLLTIIKDKHPWTGKPSTTQLLNGYLQEYLKIKENYAVSPEGMAFSLLGSAHHMKLAEAVGPWVSEQRIEAPYTGGTPDLLEPDSNQDGYYMLTDYKTFGSYKVSRILGIQSKKVSHPTEKYVKSGTWGKAGDPKKITEFYTDESKIDMRNEELQLNHYRVMLEDEGWKISQMRLQITVRDGGTQVATGRGIMKNIYYPIHVRKLDNDRIRQHFEHRAKTLISHINNSVEPAICDEEERWNDRRCESYCDVAKYCPHGQFVLLKEGK